MCAPAAVAVLVLSPASRIDGLYKAWFADRDMDAPGDGIEKGHVRSSRDGPAIRDLARGTIDFEERAIAA